MGDLSTKSSSPPSAGDFTFEEIQALECDDLFRARTGPGIRKVSTETLSGFWNAPSSSSSLAAPSATVRFIGHDRRQQRQGSFEMPTAVISAEVLEFVGFNQATAKTVCERFMNRPDPSINVDSFLDYATSQVQQMRVLETTDYTDREIMAREAMALVGLTTDFQDRMLGPRFKTVYGTENLLFWVLDTLKVGYLALEQLHDRLKDRVRIIEAKGKVKAKRALKQENSSNGPSQAALPQTTATVSQTPKDHSLPANLISIETGPALPSPLEYMVLYKATAALEMGGNSWIDDDGIVDMNVMSSVPGGDFSYRSMVHGWTPEREVAKLYREWAQRRCPYSETWVVRICVPITLINSIPTTELWFSPDWKEFVWYCRRKRRPPEKFNYLDPENRAIGLIKGHISTNMAQQVAHIRKADVQSTISDDFVLRNPITGSMGTQWVFTIPSIIDRLGVEIRGSIHIDVTAATKGDGTE
ncbi:hypothetical protein VE02_05525 [Pseudogymnoascus sp. 03VT05]|nr:hypothetical protein VE02_05525 [Pseudogymnoascus sp. 03VT05]